MQIQRPLDGIRAAHTPQQGASSRHERGPLEIQKPTREQARVCMVANILCGRRRLVVCLPLSPGMYERALRATNPRRETRDRGWVYSKGFPNIFKEERAIGKRVTLERCDFPN